MTLVAEGGQIQVKTTIVTDFETVPKTTATFSDGAEHDIVSAGLGTGRRSATRVDDRVFKSVDHLKGPTGETTIERSFAPVEGSNELTIDLTSEGFRRTQFRSLTACSHEATIRRRRREQHRGCSQSISTVSRWRRRRFCRTGKLALVYWSLLRNFRGGDIEWNRLEVQDDAGRTLASYEGEHGRSPGDILAKPGTPPGL